MNVNGRPAKFVDDDMSPAADPVWSVGKNGRIRVVLPHPGTYEIKAWYDGPPGWAIRNAAMVLLLALVSYILYRQRNVINRST